MKGSEIMDAKMYIQRINEICDCLEKSEMCNSECPLKEYGCGIPKLSTDIGKVIKIVKEFNERKLTGICTACGRNNKDLIEQQQIKFCPGCGAEIDNDEKK